MLNYQCSIINVQLSMFNIISMKSKNIQPLLIASAICCCFLTALTSCNNIVDYDEMDYISPENIPNTGAPQITGVYEVRDVIFDTPLSSIAPGQRIRLRGTNLNHVQRISFNSIEVPAQQAACASDYCVVKVPEEFDIRQTEGISYTTDMGTTTTDITITPLSLVMNGLSNAFAPAGQDAIINGQHFKAYHFGEDEATSVILNGSTPLQVKEVTVSSMLVNIPGDTPDNSTISFNWTTAEGTPMTYTSHYRPTAYRCFTTLPLTLGDSFNDQEGYDLNAVIEPDGADGTPPLGSPMLHITGKAKQWGWYSANIDAALSTPYNIAGQNEYDPSLTKGYLFQFEAMALKPVPSSDDAETNGIMFSIEWGESCEWSPDNSKLPEGQWVTISLPLSKVATKGLRPVSWGGTTHLSMIISPIVDNAEFDLRLSNFRIVKNLNPEEEEQETIPTPTPDPTPAPTPDTPSANYGIIFNTSTEMGGWTTIDENTLSASLFTGIKAGDKIIVKASESDGGQVWIAKLTGSSWSEENILDGVSIDTEVSYIMTEDDAAIIAQRGIRLKGKNFTLSSIELEKGSE